MATLFNESGSDATGDLTFYNSTVGTVTSSTAQFRTGLRSVKADSGAGAALGYTLKTTLLADAGARISCGVYVESLHAASVAVLAVATSGGTVLFSLRVSSTGALQLWHATAQIGSNGSTLSLAQWYRVTLAYTVTSTTVNQFRVYLDDSAVADISVTNATLSATGTSALRLGWATGTATANKVVYVDDVHVDNSAGLAAFSGDMHVTSKLPAALNTNSFDTLIGSATNRWEYVNERPASESKGIQHAAATDVQENFGLAGASVGDVDITYATLVSRTAWLIAKRGALTPCTHRASAASGTANPTTTFTITIPASTATGDSLFVQVLSGGHTSGTAYMTVTDNDTGGNTWTRIAESTDRKATLWWKRATSATASKTITVAGCVDSSAGGVAVYQNAATSVTPYTNINVEANADSDETAAGITPDIAGSTVCFGVWNTVNTACTLQSTVNLGAMVKAWEQLSTGGANSAAFHAYLNGTDTAAAATGNITWSQANNNPTTSIVWAVRPEDTLGSPDIMDNGSETAITLTPTSALKTKITDSTSYPSNAAGIGLRSTGVILDTYLYECGTLIAYIPGVAPSGPPAGSLALLGCGR